jgi:hypothetical protein
MLNRTYSADMRRFISTDPSGIDGGVNLYAYGNLNPLFFVDPYGLCAESFWSKAQNAAKEIGDIFEVEFSSGLQAKLKVGVGAVGIDFGSERWGVEGSAIKETTTKGFELGVGVKNLLGASAGGLAEREGYAQEQIFNPYTGQRIQGESIQEYMQGYEAKPIGSLSAGSLRINDGGDVRVEFGAAVILGVEVRVNLTETYDFIQKVRQ